MILRVQVTVTETEMEQGTEQAAVIKKVISLCRER